MSDLFNRPISIKFKQGLEADINTTTTKNLAVTGEPHYVTDTEQLYIFNGTTNRRVINLNVATVTASSVTLDEDDDVILCDCSSNAITVNLPAASDYIGKVFYIKKIDVSVNSTTVDGDGSETIDGSTTISLTTQYESVTIVSNGTNWFIL